MDKDSRSQQPMMTSPMQILQSQLGLTPQQLQVLMHHHQQQQQQQQLAFQSVSEERLRESFHFTLTHLLGVFRSHSEQAA